MKKILFVCTGNTCRSSMAEAIARQEIKKRGMKDKIEVSSAGLSALPGDKASPQAVEVMSSCGLDIRGHRAKQLSLELIDKADLILTMTEGHKKEIINFDPESRRKVFSLIEYADGKSGDIPDPFGGSVEIYRKCASVLKEYIIKALDKFISHEACS